MRTHQLHRTFTLALFAAAALTGCQNAPPPKPPVVPPESAVSVNSFVGSPLTGPTLDKPDAFKPLDALSVKAHFVGLVDGPAFGRPLAAAARMIVQSGRDVPVMPAEQLLRGAWFEASTQPTLTYPPIQSSTPHEGDYEADIATKTAALPPGVTVSFSIIDAVGLDEAASTGATHRRLNIEVYRSPDNRMMLAVVLSNLAEQLPERTEVTLPRENRAETARSASVPARSAAASRTNRITTAAAPSPVFQRELALIDLAPVSTGGESALVGVPIHFAGTDTKYILVSLSLSPGSSTPEHLADAKQCSEQLQKSADIVANSPRHLTVISPQWSRYRVALNALTDPNRRRAAIVYLAAQTNASLCRDVALVAEPAILDHLSADIRRAVVAPGPTTAPSSEDLGWTLDRETFLLLTSLMNDAKLPLELSAVVTSAVGQPGRDANSMKEISQSSLATRQTFNTRLQAENLIFLEDSSLAARVRAYDWLSARGLAPPGFDPQGTRKQRRAALEIFLNPPNNAPAGGAK